jgi:hypothetical protein
MLTGFTYRGLSPHKFTPMPCIHKALHWVFTLLSSVKDSELKTLKINKKEIGK